MPIRSGMSFAITSDQRERVLALQIGKLYPSVFALLMLARWRQGIQPEIQQHFFDRYTGGGGQHVCTLESQSAELARWFRQYWPAATSRAIVEVGIATWMDLIHQGYSPSQIGKHVSELKNQTFGCPGI